jgi:hypothetical protein
MYGSESLYSVIEFCDLRYFYFDDRDVGRYRISSVDGCIPPSQPPEPLHSTFGSSSKPFLLRRTPPYASTWRRRSVSVIRCKGLGIVDSKLAKPLEPEFFLKQPDWTSFHVSQHICRLEAN